MPPRIPIGVEILLGVLDLDRGGVFPFENCKLKTHEEKSRNIKSKFTKRKQLFKKKKNIPTCL
jgi:hypothetical protein